MRGQLLTRPPTASPGGTATADDDARLVAEAKVDARAFAPLYARYADPVYRYCVRRLGDREAAADATGQVFAKALAALPRFREETGTFRSWLFAVAHNVVVDEARAYRPTAPLEAAAGVAAAAPSPEEVLLDHEAAAAVRALLARLTPDQRQVMELRLAGLTGPEIAAVVGRSLGSVKIAQLRAIARLRETLGPMPEPGGEASR